MSRTDYQAALQAWHVARLQFEQADPDHIDIAIYQLCAAEKRVEVELMKVKEVTINGGGKHGSILDRRGL